MQFERDSGSMRVVNPGSVGMPYGVSDACWALLGPDVEMPRTIYDHAEAADRIRLSTWPEADTFARDHVLSVPSIAQAMSFFRSRGGR
jgi:hypothetical protein